MQKNLLEQFKHKLFFIELRHTISRISTYKSFRETPHARATQKFASIGALYFKMKI